MPWKKNIPTQYHQQDTDYYCGAATAQMILDSIGSGLLDQNNLYNSNHSHNTQSNWYTDPNGLKYTLNHYKPNPPVFNNIFVVFTRNTETEGTEKIVYTLWHYGVPTGTLVYHCGHWIVVRGVSTSKQPKAGSTYTINGFWVNNPWPPTPSSSNPSSAPPPPHSSGDGCGGGGNRGISNEYIVYNNTWKDTYFTGCDVWGVGHNQFVSVCDPSVPKLGQLTMNRDNFWTEGSRLITTEDAVKFAMRGIKEHDLLTDKIFSKAIKGAKPSKPILVQRLDQPDTFYYLVPMIKNTDVTSLLSVDGLYGNFRGGHVLDSPISEPFVDKETVLEKVVNRPIDLGQKLGKVVIREGAYCLYPIMVWKPCYESRSPFYPFYMFTIGGTNIYIGYDGTIYPELNEMGLGA